MVKTAEDDEEHHEMVVVNMNEKESYDDDYDDDEYNDEYDDDDDEFETLIHHHSPPQIDNDDDYDSYEDVYAEDGDESEEEEESNPSDTRRRHHRRKKQQQRRKQQQKRKLLLRQRMMIKPHIILARNISVAAVLTIATTTFLYFMIHNNNNRHATPSTKTTIIQRDFLQEPSIQYNCEDGTNIPSKVGNENNVNEIQNQYKRDINNHKALIINNNNNTNNTNTTTSWEELEFDDWGFGPNEKKKLQRHWIHWYADNLQSGDSIYESACGIGLTMYTTLELLRDEYNIYPLQAYGSDYLADSIEVANSFYDLHENDIITSSSTLPSSSSDNNNNNEDHHERRKKNVIKGKFCRGDSTQLSFVPSSSFDLVFTGYISPKEHPTPKNVIWTSTQYERYCHLAKSDKDLDDLINMDQKAQEDWIALWITEMLRIVKPGKVIIIESMQLSRCEHPTGWGGISKQHWRKDNDEKDKKKKNNKDSIFIERYGWDDLIDFESIEIIDFNPDNIVSGFNTRYNVKMRRKVSST